MTELALLAFAGAVAAGAPRAIVGAGWAVRAPRLALWAWYAATLTIVGSTCLAAASALLHLDHLVGPAWRVCLDALQGAHGPGGQVGAAVGLLLLGVVGVRLVVSGWAVRRSTRRERVRQRDLLRRSARRDGTLQAMVVADARPAAYLLPGRRHEIVVTTAAIDLLTPGELRAVLAHERAHASGHHALLRNAAHVLHRAFPRLPVFGCAAREVARLVEVCADDTAIRDHARIDLARALVAMANPTGPATVHASGGDVTARLYRLLEPPTPLPFLSGAGVAAALLTVTGLPLLIAAL
jgi:Zn-dependent protease with chaperone function